MPVFENFTWELAVMALLALTVARMIPVAISMVGTRLTLPTLLYMGWFGPRGLATIVFASLVVTESDLAGIETIVAVATTTVAASVVLHGLTAFPGSEAYGNWYEKQDKTSLEEAKKVHHHLRPNARRLTDTAQASTPQPGE